MSWCHIYYITSVILYIYSGYVTASEYCVSAAPNGKESSSTNTSCHKLSYYIADYSSYFTDDAIFYFLEGTHTLQGILNISNVSNITLQGLGHIEQGFHEIVMQSTSVIRCSDSNRTGILFSSSGNITIKSLTIANCGFDNYISYEELPRNPNGTYWYHRVSLFIVNIDSVMLECVSVQNSSGNGLVLVNAYNVLIDNSSLANNGVSGNALIVYDDQFKKLSRVIIMKSNFSFGLGHGIDLLYSNDNEANIIIANSMFSNNIERSGGGVNISLHGGGSIEFSNCTICNNTAWYDGAGVDIYTYGNGSIEFSNCRIYNNTVKYDNGGGVYIRSFTESVSIEFFNCTIYNNTALYWGGGVYFYSYRNCSIEFSNCIIYNNTARYDGGGVGIYMYRSGSIEFSNCTIYNNTAWYWGGGVDFYSYGNGSIEFSNCTIYNNTAQYRGGGMNFYSDGSGSIEFSNCIIYNNTARYWGGGVYFYLYRNGSIEFSNCTIYNNTARYDGGGVSIYMYRSGSIEFSNCRIYNNTVKYDDGGGVYIRSFTETVSIEFFNCTIYNNTARYWGGGVYFISYGNCSIEFSNCIIYNNTARYDGGGVGIYMYRSGSIEFSNCTIYNNTAWYWGGGVDFNLNGNGSIEFNNCTIYNNTARYWGGGVYFYSYGNGSIEFSNCIIYNNTAQYDGGGVGIKSKRNGSIEFINCTIYNNTAWYNGGGVYFYTYGNGSIEFSNCIIYNNTAQYWGGGVYLYSYMNGSIEFSNCTIYSNTAEDDGGGVGIYTYGNGSIEFSNCTIYNNTAWYDGGGVYFYTYGNGSIEFSNCIIYNNTAQYWGGGVYLYSYMNGSIEFSNCTIYSNTAEDDGGGVGIYTYGNGSIEFSNCTIYNNTAWYDGGGVYFYSYKNRSIEFSNCIIYNNTARYDGGGVDIIESNGNGSIEFSNCIIYNNTARYDGGGVGIKSKRNGSIEFINCTIYNNTAWYDGGGVYFYTYGNGSIEFSNCIIYNNTARYWGGGVYFYSYGNGSIEFSNCIIYNNTARYDGGGVGIKSKRNGSIEFINCTIYNNTAWYDGGGVYFYTYGNGSIEFSNCIIYNNTARYWGGGVYLYSYMNGSIEFSNCTIYSNTAEDDGGGVGIYTYGNGSIEFSNCTIYNNIAQNDGGGVDFHLTGNVIIEFSNCIISNNTAQYDGGGVEIKSNGSGNIVFSNCKIYNNTAQSDNGGGVYINWSTGNVSIDFFNCTIYNNTAQSYGGGVDISLHSESGNIAFINCTIYCNSAQHYGGGLSTYLYTKHGSNDFSNCSISNNTAYFGSGLFLRSFREASTSSFHFTKVSILFNEVINNLYLYPKSNQSALELINVNDITFDQIEVSNHNTTGLVGINSLITFYGHNVFENNSGIYGGGIALYGSSQLLIKEHANISFVNNHASKSGGGIFVSQVLGQENTTDCSFKVLPYHYPNDTKTVLYFVDNTADISGDVLYGGKIDDCTSTLYFDHLFHYPQQTGPSVVSSEPIQVCFCESKMPNCSILSINLSAIPGVDVNVSLVTVGLKDTITEGVMKLNLSDNSSTLQYGKNRLKANCTNVTFTLRINSSLNTTQVYATLNTSITEPFIDPFAKVLEVTIESCPSGYPFKNGTCVCRTELNSDSITCDNKTLMITRDGDMWIGYENESNCLIFYPHCPFDYCNKNTLSFTLNNHRKQCLHNRSGILCGQCAEGFSLMLGSNQCGQCTNNNIALIIPFALAGIALVAFIIALNLTVSVGTINGLIFYANVVKIYEPIFFPEGHETSVSFFISWVNLDLGIKTCFYRDMDSCSKAWLQFVFPAYIWFILILMIILLRYSSKMVRLVGRQIIPVLATMILLSYTKLIRTVVQALYFIPIPCSDESKNKVSLLRWSFDANVQLLQGCHISLFLFSLAVLILLIVPYTFYLLTIPLFEGPLSKYMCCCQKLLTKMKPFFDAYGGPYKDNCRFWTGFLLLVRVVLALTVSLVTNTAVSLDVLTSILIIIVFMYLILKGIYRHFPLVCLEEFLILNLLFMAYINAETSNDKYNSKRQWSSFVLVLLSLVVFCCIILYHVWDRLMFYNVWDRLFKYNWQQTFTKVKKILKKPPPPSTSNDLELPFIHPGSPDVQRRSTSMSVVSVEMNRESILFDQDD